MTKHEYEGHQRYLFQKSVRIVRSDSLIQIRRAMERGYVHHGWLETYHKFSFGDYRDREHMSFRSLRVMNEDIVAPGRGFGTHPHQDMEIVTYVLEGVLEHRDSMGHGEILRPGEFQRMSAGTGITHSEFNPSESEPVHLYQIWLFPHTKGLTPGYEQKTFPPGERRNKLQLVASQDGQSGSLRINQDARIYLSDVTADAILQHQLPDRRHGWLQVLSGSLTLNGDRLDTGDGAAVSDEALLNIQAIKDAELMLFDLA